MNLIKTYSLFIILLFLSTNIYCQSFRPVNDTIITNLVSIAQSGNKRSLRDLGTFLNHPKLKTKVQKILKKLTFFHDNQIYDSKEKFLNYYYTQEKNIEFDGLNAVFHNAKSKQAKLSIQFKPIQIISTREKDINQLDAAELKAYIDEITSPKSDFPIKKLFEIYLNYQNSVKLSNSDLQKIIQKLASKPDISSLSKLIEIGKNSKETGTILNLIEKIALVNQLENQSDLDFLESVNQMVDTIGSMDQIRLLHYANQTDFSPKYYYETVDYLGHILVFSDNMDQLHQLLVDLEMTHNSRALFYLASFAFLHKDEPVLYKIAIDKIEQLTQKQLGVANGSNKIIYENFDIDAFKHYLTYWSENAESYIWDDAVQRFVNEKDIKKKKASYDSYIQLLYSKNDSIARAAFLKLANSEPENIEQLVQKIKNKQKTINPIIPNLKYKYLEQLTVLNKYCRVNGLQPSLRFKSKLLLNSLTTKKTLKEQYNIENQTIKQFSFLEITALEKAAIIYANNKFVNLSISRILDAIYSRYWDSILTETSKLNFYLKKSAIFSRIGVSGTSKSYLNKFSRQNLSSKTLNQLYKISQDEDVKNQIEKLFVKFKVFVDAKNKNTNQINIELKKLTGKEINHLNKKQIKFIFKTIKKNQNNKEVVEFLLAELQRKASIKITKNCLKLASESTTRSYIKNKLANILNIIYDDQQGIDFWVKLWQHDAKHYKLWGQKLLNAKIKLIKEKKKLTAKDFNKVLQSKYFVFEDKITCLENIHKIRPKKIKHVKFTHLIPKEDLQYFDKLDIPIKDLDNIVLFFDANTSKEQLLLLNFLIKQTKDNKISKKAKLLNDLFRQPFFIDALENDVLPDEQISEIKHILTENLEQADYISEYDEELTISNIARLDLLDKNIIEQIKMSIRLDVPENIKAKLQHEIISRIDLNDVIYMMPYFHQLSVSKSYNPKTFLYKDFGIPIFPPYSAELLDKLVNLLENNNRYDLYYYFLKLNKIDFTGNRGNLDFDKIYKLLKFGSTTTFCSSSGGIDDYFTYSIIKLLEFHFRTRLGFHKKLNENQTFYVFTTFARAEKWMKFLEDKRLVKLPTYLSYSFNHVVR